MAKVRVSSKLAAEKAAADAGEARRTHAARLIGGSSSGHYIIVVRLVPRDAPEDNTTAPTSTARFGSSNSGRTVTRVAISPTTATRLAGKTTPTLISRSPPLPYDASNGNA